MESEETEKASLLPDKSETSNLNNQATKVLSKSDEAEQKIWDIIQGVPALNTMYGSLRLIVYISKGNKEESWKSVKGMLKGVVQSAAIAGSVFIGPVITPAVGIATGALTAIVTESLQGMSHVIIFIMENSGQLKKEDSTDGKEKLIYNQVKDIPTIGAVYSSARTPIYAAKGENNEVKASGVHAVGGTADTAITCGLNMLPIVDTQTKGVIQAISRSIIQLLSNKVLEDVEKKRIALEKKSVPSEESEKSDDKNNTNSHSNNRNESIDSNEDCSTLKFEGELQIVKNEEFMSEELKFSANLPEKSVKSKNAIRTRISRLLKSSSKSKPVSEEIVSDQLEVATSSDSIKDKDKVNTRRDSKIIIISLEDEQESSESTLNKSNTNENVSFSDEVLPVKPDAAIVSAVKRIAKFLKRYEHKSKLQTNSEEFSSKDSIPDQLQQGKGREGTKRDSKILVIALEDEQPANNLQSQPDFESESNKNVALEEEADISSIQGAKATKDSSDATVIIALKRIATLLKFNGNKSSLQTNAKEFPSEENITEESRNLESNENRKRDSKIIIIALDDEDETDNFESLEVKQDEREGYTNINEKVKPEAGIIVALKRIANLFKPEAEHKLTESYSDEAIFYLDNNDDAGNNSKQFEQNTPEREKSNVSDKISESDPELSNSNLKFQKDPEADREAGKSSEDSMQESICQLSESEYPNVKAKVTIKSKFSKFLKRSSMNKSEMQNQVKSESINSVDKDQL